MDISVEQKIADARPGLDRINPLAAKIVLGFGGVNLLLGVALMYTGGTSQTRDLAVVNDFLTIKVYAVLFIMLGALMLTAYHLNHWKLMRNLLLVGLSLKALWMYALIALVWGGGRSWVLLVIWVFFTYVQAVTYIDFVPTLKRKTDG